VVMAPGKTGDTRKDGNRALLVVWLVSIAFALGLYTHISGPSWIPH